MIVYRVEDDEQISLSVTVVTKEIRALMRTPGGLRSAVEKSGFEPIVRIEDASRSVFTEVGLKMKREELWFFVRQRSYSTERFEEMEISRFSAFAYDKRMEQILSSLMVAANNPHLMAWRDMKETEAGLYW